MTVVTGTDMRVALGPARNQGRRPTCLAFATSAVHQNAHAHHTELCVEWLYYQAVIQAGDGPEDGSTIEHTRTVIATIGQPEEVFWPYRDVEPDPSAWHPPGAVDHLFRCESALCDGDLSELHRELSAATPIVLVLAISDAFYGGWDIIGDEAVLRDDDKPIEQDPGHAVVAVGYGYVNDIPVLLIRNSWGPRWGKDGHAWVPERYITRRLRGAFVVHHGGKDVLQSDVASSHSRTRMG